MKRVVAAAAAVLLFAAPVSATALSATIAVGSVGGGQATYDVTVHNASNPYLLWVGQRCYLAGDVVDIQHQGVQWTVTPAKGNKSDGIGFAGPFETAGIHHGSAGDTSWTSDECEAWVWVWPDLDPVSNVVSFTVGP